MKKWLFIMLIFTSFTVNANCYYNGNLYPPGTVIGGLTCQADGSWR